MSDEEDPVLCLIPVESEIAGVVERVPELSLPFGLDDLFDVPPLWRERPPEYTIDIVNPEDCPTHGLGGLLRFPRDDVPER